MSLLKENMPKQSELDALPIVGKQPENEREEAYLREICSFEFMNIEEPGMKLTFPYGNTRYMKNFNLFHGGVYKLPRHVARHVESCCTPIWKYRPDGSGTMTKQKIGEKPRFQMRQKFGE
jgi:hypothetical protein